MDSIRDNQGSGGAQGMRVSRVWDLRVGLEDGGVTAVEVMMTESVPPREQ